ncbi:palmitoyl-protein thioesterase ABHD10, mitochondrial-like [Lytechinus pictus]|uniref:palmitoyl-protein thioesterase ABHD10, mitochondrial-like n=1 Tax=Lytechinus pictus TaxID=7653 RepID=UPI0030B9E6D0
MSAPLCYFRSCLNFRMFCLSAPKSNSRLQIQQRFMMTDDRESLEHLQRTHTSSIAFRQTPGKDPGVVFLPGYMSNMTGGKAVALEGYCRRRGHAFVRFDYQGLGESIGEMRKGEKMFDVWKSDALAVLDELTVGPQILVGSSMGGAIMLLLALERPERIHSLLGVATAVQFDRPMSEQKRGHVHEARGSIPSDSSYTAPHNFVDKHYTRCLNQNPMPVKQPIRLIHGMKDDVVPFQTSVSLAERLESKNVDVILRKEGAHRMSEPEDIRLLVDCLEELLKL